MENLIIGLLLLILANLIHVEVQSALNRRDIKQLMDKVCPKKVKEESE